MICARCKMDKEAHKANPHLCDACVKAEDSRVSFYRQQNYNWMEVAEEAKLELWERQPAETDHEYHVWLAYRDAYPGKRPSYRGVAEQLCTTLGAVNKIGTRWSFPARLQAWAKHCDELTLAQRKKEILEMNKDHVDMAATLRNKLKSAIDHIKPELLTPGEINQLFKTAADIEKKARIDTMDRDRPVATNAEGSTELRDSTVKSGNINEIIEILSKAGQLGVRHTVTTEVLVKDDEKV